MSSFSVPTCRSETHIVIEFKSLYIVQSTEYLTPMILMALLRTEPNLSEAMPKCRPTKTNTGRYTMYGRHAKEDYDPMKVTLIDVLSMADRCRHSRLIVYSLW